MAICGGSSHPVGQVAIDEGDHPWVRKPSCVWGEGSPLGQVAICEGEVSPLGQVAIREGEGLPLGQVAILCMRGRVTPGSDGHP